MWLCLYVCILYSHKKHVQLTPLYNIMCKEQTKSKVSINVKYFQYLIFCYSVSFITELSKGNAFISCRAYYFGILIFQILYVIMNTRVQSPHPWLVLVPVVISNRECLRHTGRRSVLHAYSYIFNKVAIA